MTFAMNPDFQMHTAQQYGLARPPVVNGFTVPTQIRVH